MLGATISRGRLCFVEGATSFTRGETFLTFEKSPPGDFYDAGGEVLKGAKIVRDTGVNIHLSRDACTCRSIEIL